VKAKARFASPFGRIAVVLALLGVVLAAAAPAQAAQTHIFSFSAAEFLDDPQGLAVDQSGGPTDGHVWIGNGANGPYNSPVVLITDSAGNGIVTASPITPFVTPSSIAVDGSGNGYVADTGNDTIYKFAPDGTLLWEVNENSFPEAKGMEIELMAVDPSSGHLIVVKGSMWTPGQVLEIDGAGNLVGTTPDETGQPTGLAVGSNGARYLIEHPLTGGTYGVDELDAAGKFQRRLDDEPASGVAYDPVNDQLVVDHGSYISIYDATSGQQVDKFGSGSLFEGQRAGVDGNTGVVYALETQNSGSGGGKLDAFVPAALPDVAVGAVSALGSTSVTLNGHVDPAGGGEVTSCEFEFGETAGYGQSAPCSPATPYSAPVDVSAELTGLAPATEYHYRLSAGNAHGAAHVEQDHTFVTGPDVPQLLSQIVADLGSDNARIDSTIKVMGADTNVRVEYGTTTAYGSVAPPSGKVSAASGPADQASRSVPVQLTGLAPATAYHYRVVITNSAGTTTGTDEVFTTFPIPENVLADGRAYELVSPLNKHAHGMPHEYGIATDDGDAVLYPAAVSIGNTASGNQTFAVARRIDGTWTPDSPYLRSNSLGIGQYPIMPWFSADLSMFSFSGTGYTPEGEYPGLYLSNRTGTVRASIGSLDPPVEGPGAADPVLRFEEFMTAGASPDMSSLYFAYNGALLTEDSPRIPGMASKHIGGFYEYRNGQLTAADRLPDGSLDPEGAVPAATARTNLAVLNVDRQPAGFLNQVSADGSRAFFVSPDPAAGSPRPIELYVHRDSQSSLLASRSELSGEAAATGAVAMPGADLNQNSLNLTEHPYASASPNGSHVFFESKDQLTADAPADTAVKGYLFDVDTQQLSYVPGVGGTVLDASNDGSRLFFVEGEELALWEAGAGVTEIASGSARFQVSAATPDGSALVFTPVSPLPGFNNGGLRQVYRYETASKQLDCLSCPAAGVSPAAGSYLAGEDRLDQGGALTGELKAPHYYADEGRRVFFETGQPLATSDINSASDVYEWEAGHIHLISDGRDRRGSFLVDNSASGDDAFFVTAAELDPRDVDGGPDLYDARVGGGNDEATGLAACGSSCQGEPIAPPQPPNVASIGFEGRGNAGSGAKPRVSVRRRSGQVGTFGLAVKASGPGRISAWGPGVKKASRATPKAGSYELTLSLSSRAREKLKQEHELTVKVRVVFTPATGKPSTTSVSVTLKA
jgi:hypothetical protein